MTMLKVQRYKAQNQADLLRELVKTRFKLRYNNSILGFIWVLIKPLMNFLILYYIFTALRGGVHDSNYAIELLLGLIMFTFLNEGTIFGMNSLLDVANIILKINFPRRLAVTSAVLMALINFLINFLILIILGIFLGGININILSLIYFVAVIGLLFFIINTFSLYLSIILVKVRDFTNIMELFFQLLFWGSAVFIPFYELKGTIGEIIRLNPVAILIETARQAFIHGEVSHVKSFLVITLVVCIFFYLGTKFFNKNITKVAESF